MMRVSEIDTPAVLIDADVLERNIRRAAEQCGKHQVALRPHIKTHKMPPIAHMQVDAGAVGISVAKLGEAEVMADAGIRDLLVAYPIVGAAKLRRLASLAERARVTVALDSFEVAEGVDRAARDAGREIGVLVEVDTGTGRCGVAPEELLALCRRISSLRHARWHGIMTYQGYISGDLETRERLMRVENSRVNGLLDRLERDNLHPEVVSGASTPNLDLCHLLERVNENRSGTYVFNDRNTVSTGSVGWEECALRVAVTVVSTAVPGQIIVDGGSKTFSSDRMAGGPDSGFGRIVEEPSLQFVKMNEEHGFLKVEGTARPRVGDRLHLIPNHVCVVVNMHDQVYLHRGDEVIDCWPVAARGKVR
jgi:D-serine deaminase-like pyridoxal phosphate-dependent protein